jgi:hypothetical protein
MILMKILLVLFIIYLIISLIVGLWASLNVIDKPILFSFLWPLWLYAYIRYFVYWRFRI